MPEYDVLIVGGGPVGAAAALALRGSGLEVGLLDGRAARAGGGSADARPIALAHGSRLVLERLGVWERLRAATPIERIHVSQRGGFGRVELDATEAGLPALGYVVDYDQLDGALTGALEAQGGCKVVQARGGLLEPATQWAIVHYESAQGPGQATARLVAAADGGARAAARPPTRDYGQAVVTARVGCTRPRRNVAFERFTPEGPLALLPDGESYALVWTTGPERAQELCTLGDADFLARLQEAFGGRLGIFDRAGARSRYPIALKVAERIADSRIVALGNAAQTLHPVAGQGLNLGLRDAWELAQLLRACSREQIGAAPLLARYRARRRLDRRGGIGFTDSLVRLFSNDIMPVKLARGLGLALLGAAPPARDFIVKRMTFGARG